MNGNTHSTHPNSTEEGRGESNTLHLLRERYRCSYITVEQLLADRLLPQYSSLDSLRRAIKAGRIPELVDRLGGGSKGATIVYLSKLADFIDQSTTAASQAA